jgi:hypothetical protein
MGLERLRVRGVVFVENRVDHLDGGRKQVHAGLFCRQPNDVHVLPHVDPRLGHGWDRHISGPAPAEQKLKAYRCRQQRCKRCQNT